VEALVAVAWGLFGGFAVEGLELYAAVRRRGVLPWRVKAHGRRPPAGPLAYAIAETIRMLIGAGLAGAISGSGQPLTPMGAVAIGVATPIIVQRILETFPESAAVTADDSQRGSDSARTPRSVSVGGDSTCSADNCPLVGTNSGLGVAEP